MKKINTKMNVANKYENKLESIEKDFDGIWAYSMDGWKFADTDCHTTHEMNQKDLYKSIQTLTPCECKECQKPSENDIEKTEENSVVDNREPSASATMKPAGKKFKYEVDIDGEKEERLAVKGEYTHVLIAKPMDVKENEELEYREWFVYSYHKSYDLANKAALALEPKTKKTKWNHYPHHTRIISVK